MSTPAHLPLEIWQHIFGYLLPKKELGYLCAKRTPYTIPLYFAEGEDAIIKETVETLAYTPDLLFKDSEIFYRQVLLANAYWTIGAKSTGWWPEWQGYVGATGDLKEVQDEWEGAVQHLVLIVDTTIETENPSGGEYEYSAVTYALISIADVVDSFPALKTFDIYFDFDSPTPQRWSWDSNITTEFSRLVFGNWVSPGQPAVLPEAPIFDNNGDIVGGMDWLEQLLGVGVKLGVFVRTAQDAERIGSRQLWRQLRSFVLALVEDITELWTEPLPSGMSSSEKDDVICDRILAAMREGRLEQADLDS